mmetsp:Transcript_18404/g.27593  ORF Transcript_18404/g.27593 Transcript_18404/m.27593 type:complete len:144 (-) Transcript_18404:2961-3392(-)
MSAECVSPTKTIMIDWLNGRLADNINGNTNGNSSNNSSLSSTMEPKKDRRTMLEEWRAQNKAKEANKVLLSGSGTQHQHQLVQSRQQPVPQLVDKENTYSLAHTSTETPSRLMSMLMSMPPPLPPSSSTESTTAVERFRMRYL